MYRNWRNTLWTSLVMVLGAGYAINGLSGEVEAKVRALVTETCVGCHGVDGNSPIPTVPKIAGQQKVYLLNELKFYKEEKRHSDVMTAMVASLNDDELAGLAAYYSAQTPSPGEVTKPNLLALGKRVYLEGNTKSGVPSCDGCHEENGEGSKKFPRVAGQHVPYVLEELGRYAADKRNSGSKVMRTVAERLTKEEAEAVAEYMASQK